MIGGRLKNKIMMDTAWMIRNDGKEIPVEAHPYVAFDLIEQSLEAAEWLYKNTRYQETKALAIDFIDAYAESVMEASDNIVDVLLKNVKDSREYFSLSREFIHSVSGELLLKKKVSFPLDTLQHRINYELNQEFLRARYGGMYNTVSGSKEMVFRISSTGFNWYPVIFEFVDKRKERIDSVTIVRDREATGQIDAYYKTNDGKNVYRQFPLEDFLAEKVLNP